MASLKRKAESDAEPAASAATSASSAKRPAFAAAASSASGDAEPAVKKEEPADGMDGDADAAKEEEEMEAYTPQSHLAGLKRDAAGHIICPYLDTINRRALDFDFEKLCSVSLANANVYACLVCGKYFQGRGKSSHAYAHSLNPELEHHVFINLATEEIYCLPDGYQIFDRSLEDIRENLHPRFNESDLQKLDSNTSFIHALDGTDYLPGLVGLNNIKKTDWLNVIIQALNFIPHFRNFFILQDKQGRTGVQAVVQAQAQAQAKKILPPGAKAAAASSGHAAASSSAAATPASHVSGAALIPRSTELSNKYSELLAKIWNPRSFKGHVSPHELLQCLSALSGKRFSIGKFADALQVLSFMLNQLHKELAAPGTKRKGKLDLSQPNPLIATGSIVHETFQGEIRITTTIVGDDSAAAANAEGEDGAAAAAAATTTTVEHRPFLYLSLALPPAPLFKDAQDRAIIPQIPLFELLKKFDGHTAEVSVDPATKREVHKVYSITRLPRYLILHYQRFHENNWFWEKNPTLVNFPLQRLDLSPYISGPEALGPAPTVNGAAALTPESVRSMGVAEMKRMLRARKVACDNVVEKEELMRLMLSSPSSSSSSSSSAAAVSSGASTSSCYDLLSNIVHEGATGAAAKELGGIYKCHTHHRASNTWYLTEDLHVHTSETMEQLVSLSESYIQVYERQKE